MDQCFMKITWTKTPDMTPIKHEDQDIEMPKELSSSPSSGEGGMPENGSLSTPLSKRIKQELIQQGSSNQYQGSTKDLSGSWTMLTQFSHNQSSSFFNVSPKLDPYGDEVIFMGISTEPIEIYDHEDEDIVYISTSNIQDSNNGDLIFVKEEKPKQPGNQTEDSAAKKVRRNPQKACQRRLSDPNASPGTSRHMKVRSTVSTSTPKQSTLCPATKQTTDRNNNSANRSVETLTPKSIAVQTIPTDGMATQLQEKLAFIHNMNGRFFAIYGTDYRHDKEFILVYKIGWRFMRCYDRDVEPVFFYRLFHDFAVAKDAYPRSYIHIFHRLKGYLQAAMDKSIELQRFQMPGYSIGK
ncbi:uncharacterized protein LOC127870812 [Dreissena polymorpha]|uniref:uncharacterized protein LOC127870812 n=1 Tax=Dreissena polymorpha TaxID=45954 RepID=UPI0022652929|nr:uncharacterized protein LOC127870812 [Dreissena polymorpha]XP_052269292.1 uncharacterized protein LOC127870812 [Dreissena polymorpha]XP_052269293.1 uncharacterized protein LOC127870812 [Dreissena polymorpha]XP_052269294.1 uncharacterized protein LOC127870812 [Dreissena polymorpha]XP_052269295.1 uncharacterized protein LOC127870812 [Dreissena polymorpha]XP_052269296.1 uncharacterized protein LOC127870812 [Dreissena polymorpha]